ncbi:pyridoxamine 5'-phosphate oxidase family protein [Streptomyces sp. NPDC050535]|uniref:pyridoxamine 5'-phosphate oxidase family protein n=1 Tax=Streptomyces sp. NPDC050535 TaxID=3365626 RepID=UPI003793F76C
MTFHAGSRAVQDRVGVRDIADHVGQSVGQGIRPVAAAFLEQQPMLVLGAADPASGAVWASLLTGEPGFVRATGPHQISVRGGLRPDDPLTAALAPQSPSAEAAALAAGDTYAGVAMPATDGTPAGATAPATESTSAGAVPRVAEDTLDDSAAQNPGGAALPLGGIPVGTIALDPRTRRRMRLNGRARPTPRGFVVEADQVFANCPKYLQRRESYETVDRASAAPRRGSELTTRQREFIESADTFFIATVHGEGADASHRGGNPGFVRADSPGELSWRDYPGNSMFLTLGNLSVDPRAGLLFLDWTSGAVLQLTGTARTEFDRDGERAVRFAVASVVETPAASPLTWSAPGYSAANPTPAR